MTYFLYIKTHNKTGLKYLGRTQNDPYTYKGSGVRWNNHLKKHGNNISTEIIGAFDTLDDLKVAGTFWSQKWNIVKSNKWANLTEETGEGVAKGRSKLKRRTYEEIYGTEKANQLRLDRSQKLKGNKNFSEIPWNKGLTKYTDIRLYNIGQKESATKRSL